MSTNDDNAVVDTAVADAVPEVAAEPVSEPVPEVVPEVAVEVVPEVVPEVAVEVVPEVVPEVAAETPVTVPEVVAETPVTVPEVVAETPVPNVKKIVFALPGDNFSSKFLIAWTATISKLWETRKYDIMISPATGSYVPFVRMSTLGLDVLRGQDQKPFNGQSFDIWITIDSDIVFTFEQVEKLIQATDEHPVVAGMYRMSDLVNYAFVKDWNETYFKTNGTFQFIKPEEIDIWKKETEFKYFPVVYSGMGFMAIRKEVFDKIRYPYFDSEVITIHTEDGKVIRDICSEDVSFCKKITEAGYQIMVNTDIRVGHIKSLVI
jgi:hypothetical protein